jgi:hypothetical protein
MKNILMAAPVALAVAFFAVPAQAGASAGIAVGEPYPGYYPNPGYHPYPPPYYDEEDDEDQISCWEGRQIVRERNFRQVRPVKCQGTIYRYRAIKRGRPWLVRVNSFTAQVVSARPINRY